MSSINVKDLPPSVHEQLKQAARSEGKSLNAYIISVLADSVGEHTRRQQMREGRVAFRKFLQSLPQEGDSVALIREDRDSR